jgi:hypothetical protein
MTNERPASWRMPSPKQMESRHEVITMPKLEIARAQEPDDKSLIELSGNEIEIVPYGPNAEFWTRIKSLDDKMPNGKALGDCTLEELDMIGDFFSGEATVEDVGE